MNQIRSQSIFGHDYIAYTLNKNIKCKTKRIFKKIKSHLFPLISEVIPSLLVDCLFVVL